MARFPFLMKWYNPSWCRTRINVVTWKCAIYSPVAIQYTIGFVYYATWYNAKKISFLFPSPFAYWHRRTFLTDNVTLPGPGLLFYFHIWWLKVSGKVHFPLPTCHYFVCKLQFLQTYFEVYAITWERQEQPDDDDDDIILLFGRKKWILANNKECISNEQWASRINKGFFSLLA